MKFDALPGCCNEGYLWNFNRGGQLWNAAANFSEDCSFSLKDLLKFVKQACGKVIMIVDKEKQKDIIYVLETLSEGKHKILQAKKLSHWSASADLWMVRSDIGSCKKWECVTQSCVSCAESSDDDE